MVRIDLETYNFSRVARIKIGHSTPLGLTGKDGPLQMRKISHSSISCAFCFEAKVIGPWQALEIRNVYLNERKNRNSVGQEHFNALAVLSIHRDGITDSPRFREKVVEFLASQGNRRGKFPLNMTTLNDCTISHNFHTLPWSMRFSCSNSIDTPIKSA
jgi:hypothetical protein